MADVRNIGFPKNIKKPKESILAAKQELIEAGILNAEGQPNSPYKIVASRDQENVGIKLVDGYDWTNIDPKDYSYISIRKRNENKEKVLKAVNEILGDEADKYSISIIRTYKRALEMKRSKKGAGSSWHMHGLAADISLKGEGNSRQAQAVLAARFMQEDAKALFPRLLIYTDDTHIHVTHADTGVGESTSMWSNSDPDQARTQSVDAFLQKHGVTSGPPAATDEKEPEEKEEAPKYVTTDKDRERQEFYAQARERAEEFYRKKEKDLEMRRAYLINRRKVDRELVNLDVAEDKAKRELESFVVTLPNRLKAKFSADFRNAKEPEAEGASADTTKRQDRTSQLYRNYYTLAKAYSDAREARNNFIEVNKALLAPENEIRENKLSDIIKQEVRKFLML